MNPSPCPLPKGKGAAQLPHPSLCATLSCKGEGTATFVPISQYLTYYVKYVNMHKMKNIALLAFIFASIANNACSKNVDSVSSSRTYPGVYKIDTMNASVEKNLGLYYLCETPKGKHWCLLSDTSEKELKKIGLKKESDGTIKINPSKFVGADLSVFYTYSHKFIFNGEFWEYKPKKKK